MSLRGVRVIARGSVALVALFAAAAPVSGQYFGRQKVNYEEFDWRIMDTERFNIHHYPAEEAVTSDAARMAERWYSRLSRAFQHEFEKKPLIFYADHPDFQQTNTTPGGLTEGTGGFTDALRNRVVMPFTGIYKENDHVLGHEMVHVFQYDLASSAGGGGLAGMNRLPLWLIEGMAEYLSLGREDAHTAMWMRDAALRGEMPTIEQLTTDPRFFPYRYGQALWAYVAGRWGDRSVTEVYRFATRAGFEVALERVLGLGHAELSRDWIEAIRANYLPLIAGRQRPQDVGDRLLYDPEPGAMNLSPVVSPDGRFVAFFGRRDIFTIDLYIADATTGEIVKKLTSPNRSQHFDALSFIQSAGSWSPDGSKFGFIIFADGDHQIAIMDIASRDVERRFTVRGVGAVNTLAWSPDGNTIAFSGTAGGISDLYALQLSDGVVRQLTNDKFADLHPAWSPDGRQLAFITDRAETNLDNLTYGDMRIATLDMGTSAVRVLDLFTNGKHINPQYSPDGRDLYFIADPEGYSDLYRVELATGQIYQITRLATGISGIVALSPAMSVASRDGRVVFSVFENAGNNIYGLTAARARGEPVSREAPRVARAAVLPPVEAVGGGFVNDYLADALTGLPEVRQFPTRDYHARLGLEYIAPPTVGVGVSDFGGAGASGGIGLLFSDMLGNQQLQAVVQANGSFKDMGGQAFYLNAENRWNWGVLGGHIPYLTGFTQLENGEAGGLTLNQYLERIYIQQLAGMTMYPFSQTRRFEVNAGFTRYAFDREVIRYFYDNAGRPTGRQPIQQEVESPDPLHFVEGSAALVGDNSFFGLTSPVAGERWRLEVSPTFGALTYQSINADYRRYFMFRPITLAFRGQHYGRYGADAEGVSGDNQRLLSPLFVGYENWIRGYDPNSFGNNECANDTSCPAFNRLWGTRVAVASMELRIPVLGVPELGLINFPYLPLEISPFFDAGLAWRAADAAQPGEISGSPSFKLARNSNERIPVFSTGVSARVNVLGYLIFEAYYAYPFQRPDKGGHFGFQLAPGW
jgi:Tol biopolymer transport system component